nr:MAG TPA: hypothetical protein [Caudoviricetes sp.]
MKNKYAVFIITHGRANRQYPLIISSKYKKVKND